MAKTFRSLRLDVTALHAMHVLRGGTCACPVCTSSETLTAAGAPEPPDMVVMIRKERTTPAAAMRKVRTASAPPTIDRNQAPPPPDMVAIILKQGDRQ